MLRNGSTSHDTAFFWLGIDFLVDLVRFSGEHGPLRSMYHDKDMQLTCEQLTSVHTTVR